MPKMKMRAKGDDKEKIRQLKQEIKDVKLDMEETFSVMEDMPKPPPVRKHKHKLTGKEVGMIAGAFIGAGLGIATVVMRIILIASK